jgi:hypothetical protein
MSPSYLIQFNCGHFKKANEFLRRAWGPDNEIDWQLGDGPPTTLAATKKDTVQVSKTLDQEAKAGDSKKEITDDTKKMSEKDGAAPDTSNPGEVKEV